MSQGVGCGLGLGISFVPLVSALTISFPRHQLPLAMGIVLSGAGLGGVIFPISTSFFLFTRSSLTTFIQCSSGSILKLNNHSAILISQQLNSRLLAQHSFGNSVRASAYISLGCLLLANVLIRTNTPVRNLKRPTLASLFSDPAYVFMMTG